MWKVDEAQLETGTEKNFKKSILLRGRHFFLDDKCLEFSPDKCLEFYLKKKKKRVLNPWPLCLLSCR